MLTDKNSPPPPFNAHSPPELTSTNKQAIHST